MGRPFRLADRRPEGPIDLTEIKAPSAIRAYSRTMSILAFALATLALLATPGPTNTLLATAGAEAGLRRSLPLLAAEVGGYLLGILLLRFVLGAFATDRPAFLHLLHGLIAAYLAYLALSLWRHGASSAPSGRSVTFDRVFVTTLLNPKAIIFAFTILPASDDLVSLLPWLVALAGQIMLAGFAWTAAGSALQARPQSAAGARLGYRTSAVVLAVMAGMMATRALAA